MASMAGLLGSTSMAGLEGSLQIGGSTRLGGIGGSKVAGARNGVTAIRAQSQTESAVVAQNSSRRAVLGLVATSLAAGSLVQAVLAEARPIKLGPPPPPSGGLSGTKNSDEARDLDLDLKKRFYLQPLPPAHAAARAKESASEILKVKELIDKKQWPYVQNDLRSKAEYLRYDLNTVISSKPKDEKKELKELTKALFDSINDLDYAAKIKSTSQAEKGYTASKSALDSVLSKLG